MHEPPRVREHSVYLLLTSLCRNIASENGLDELAVRSLRAHAYEILLRKSSEPTKWISDEENTNTDALRDLDEHFFVTKLDAKSKGEHFDDVETQLDSFLSGAGTYFSKNDGNNILRLLLALQNNLSDEEKEVPSKRPRELLVPGAFTLNAPYQKNRYYPQKAMLLPKNAEPKYFQSFQKMQATAQKGFVSQSFPKNVSNLLQTRTAKNVPTKNVAVVDDNSDCTFTGMTRRHICSDADWLRIDMRSLQFTIQKSSDFYALQMSFISRKPLRALQITDIPPVHATSEAVEYPTMEGLFEKRRTVSWSWDQIGAQNGIQCAKPFIGDLNIPFELQGLVCQAQKRKFQAKVLNTEQFLRDLKLLTIGLQSDTFYHDKEFSFNALPDVTIANVLPATMVNYIRPFLECGTSYKRLQEMTSKHDHKLTYEGFIFKAFCAALKEYLLTFRQFVFSHKGEETLISFYKRMKRFMTQIENLSVTLGLNSGADPEARLPKGSQFLGYLYREIMRLTDNEYITLLMFLLKRCCHVYFKYLQLWIFHGILDDPSRELFILYIDHYRKNTKHFYDKAYVVRKEVVPGFFQNYEDRILQCGKYTMLLKAYNANHPLFDLECPKIAVRLSFDEIQKLEASCVKYAEKAREVCGKPVTVKDIFEARAKRRNSFQQLVYQRSRENMERWNQEQRTLSNTIAEEKRKRFEELTAQLELAKQYRMEKRLQSVEIELKALREAEKHNEERMKKDNINLRKRIEYYQELSDTLRSDASETEAMSSTSMRRTRRHSLASDGETIPHTSKTPTSATTHSFSTTSLDTSRGNVDADNISTNTELSSKAFEDEFAKTAEELHAFLEERNKEYANNNFYKIALNPEDQNIKRKENLKPAVPETETKALQRSISDVINSNIAQEETTRNPFPNVDNRNELQRNRLKTLTGTIGLCFDNDQKQSVNLDNQKQPSEVLRVTFETDIPAKKVFSKALTELELNKQKVLTANEALCSNVHKDDSFRKSLPDINLNVISENTWSDLERNRKHMMEGPGLFGKALSVKSLNTLCTNSRSDLERNRRRVLTEEYALPLDQGEQHRKSLSDVDIHKLPDNMLTDMQRNRRRMMESPHPFTEYNKPALSERPKLNLALNTDRARNRRKVLESEYNIITGDTLSTREILTPMSTTSDPPLTEQLEIEPKSEKSDIINGNLRLNISASGKAENERSENLSTSVQPSTAATQPPTTPFDALTSAGIRARSGDGFKFSPAEGADHEEHNFLNLTSDCDEVDGMLEQLLTTSPYKWCKELVQSKFKCSTRSSVFRLNFGTQQYTPSSDKERSFKNFKIDSLSVITLTEFLQKSIIMPMNTHMDLVNGEVMRVLLQDLHLIDHFRSLRNYFFLMDGEFGSIICDGIIGRVESGDLPMKVLSYQMLHMILDTALSCSIQKDANAENLSFIVSDIPSKFELNSPSVLNVLSLSYRVQWPLNLILNPETLEQYGNIFKYLLKVRRISWVLEKAFELLRQAAKQHGKRLLCSPQYLRIQQIRHKFYHFVHALQNHITATALQASWKLFKDELIHAKSLEDIYRMHTQYVKRIMFLCMLNRSSVEFYNAIENIFKISLRFYNNLKSRDFVQRDGANEFTHSRFSKMISEEEEFEKLIKYTIYLGNKIVKRGYQAEIGEFITLININKYYTTQDTSEGALKPSKSSDQP